MNTLLITLNLSLTACTGILVAKNIYLHLNTEKAIREQMYEIKKFKTKIIYKCLEIERTVRGEAEVTQDQVQDIKAEIDGIKDRLVKEVKTDLETINWNLICTNKVMNSTPMITVLKKIK